MTNLKLVLRTYSALRQMSPDDIALLETLRALNDNDRELLVEMMTDKPAGKKAGRKSSTSKSSQSSTKSSRASGMAAQLNKSLGQQREAATKDIAGESEEPDIFDAVAERRLQVCAWESPDGPCFRSVDDNVHHKQTDPDYHSFQPAASPAPAPSPANGGTMDESESVSAASGD